jgi:hypothetical protein
MLRVTFAAASTVYNLGQKDRKSGMFPEQHRNGCNQTLLQHQTAAKEPSRVNCICDRSQSEALQQTKRYFQQHQRTRKIIRRRALTFSLLSNMQNAGLPVRSSKDMTPRDQASNPSCKTSHYFLLPDNHVSHRLAYSLCCIMLLS